MYFSNRTHLYFARLAVASALALASTALSFAGPIHDAARKGDVKKLQALLQQDPKLVGDKDATGDTPLHVAAFHGQVAAVQALLDAGADVNAKNSYGPFMPAEIGQFFDTSNHQDPVILLRVHGDNTKYLENGYTPLDLAMFSIKHRQIVEMLVTKGANVNARAASGATPLFWAVMRNQKDDAEFLLNHSADVNTPDAYGDTILDCALHLGYQSIVPLLVDKGADVNAIDQGQHRPLTYALQKDLPGAVSVLKKHGAHE